MKSEEPKEVSQPQPTATSDIIRVPSAEELKKGAQPEVIKAQDAQRMMTNGNKASKSPK
jgi:hypothetical protein